MNRNKDLREDDKQTPLADNFRAQVEKMRPQMPEKLKELIKKLKR